jgi:hypothetical protein
MESAFDFKLIPLNKGRFQILSRLCLHRGLHEAVRLCGESVRISDVKRSKEQSAVCADETQSKAYEYSFPRTNTEQRYEPVLYGKSRLPNS